jgi:DNA helicase HerA-like ATPase
MAMDCLGGGAVAGWPRLDRLDAYRIREIPRHGDAGISGSVHRDETDPGRPQRVAALIAAYHAGVSGAPAAPTAPVAAGVSATAGAPGAPAAEGTVAFGWIRTAAGGPVHVLAAGSALAGSAVADAQGSDAQGSNAEGDVLLSLPGGARASIMNPGAMCDLLNQLPCWRDIAGISDGLLTSAGGAPGPPQTIATPSLDECLLGSWTGPFGFVVIAEPLREAELSTLADEVARRQHMAEGAADRFPERALEARRFGERHAELRRGASTGFWRIRLAAGGGDAANTARVAGLLCASAALGELPYALSPAGAVTVEAAADDPGGNAVPSTPFCGSSELLAVLARPPRSEVPGVRLGLRPDFDVTPEAPATAGVTLGDVLDRNLMPSGSFTLPFDSLNRHVFVCGATGAGKSQTVRSILEAATGHGIPWLVVEPAKAEYRHMASRLPDVGVVRIRPGEADAIAAGINPLAPATGHDGSSFPLQTHADLVKALFIASFRSEEPFPQVLSAALTRVYTDAGWDLALGEPRSCVTAYPGLTDLQRAAERVVTEIGYSQRVTDDVLGFIRVRLASLRQGTTGRFLNGGHPLDFAALMRKNVVLEIEDVGDDRDKAFLMGTVLIRLAEHLRLTRRGAGGTTAPRLRHLTVVEEAHRLLRRQETSDAANAAASAVEMFAGLLAEIRAYGEGLIIAEQIPARLIPDVIKNTAVKIVHRLPAADDRDAVGATMNVTTAQSRYLVTLAPGQAAAFSDGMDFPVLVKIQDGTEREVASVPRTRDAASVVTPRSATCGAECASAPCTLRDMRAAQRALESSPWIQLWAELTVLAHLAGWPMPVPRPARLAELAEMPRRLSQCAVSHAVDAAVAARTPAIADLVSPWGLAAHAAEAIVTRADRDLWTCQPREPEWRVADPLPDEVAFGMARPSAVELATGAAADSAGFTRRLSVLLGEFVDCRWPLSCLGGVDAMNRSDSELEPGSLAGQGSRTPHGRP